jgi:hypothetical protein
VSSSESPAGSPSLPRILPSLRLDIEILSLMDSAKSAPLSRDGLAGLLRPELSATLGDQLDDVLESLAREKWVTLDIENNVLCFRLSERGIGALEMARSLGI